MNNRHFEDGGSMTTAKDTTARRTAVNTNDMLGLLMRDLDRYPMPNYDEQVELAKRVTAGDEEAKKAGGWRCGSDRSARSGTAPLPRSSRRRGGRGTAPGRSWSWRPTRG